MLSSQRARLFLFFIDTHQKATECNTQKKNKTNPLTHLSSPLCLHLKRAAFYPTILLVSGSKNDQKSDYEKYLIILYIGIEIYASTG